MDGPFDPGGSGADGIPFLFVPHGDPEPTEWMARHPGWVKFPATFVPHPSATTRQPPMPPVRAAVLGSTTAFLGAEIGKDALRLATADIEGVLADVAAPFAAVGIVLYPSATASPAMGEDSPLLPRHGKPAPEALVPPAPSPAPPGLVPASGGRTKPGEGGFTPAPPTPPLPGLTPAPPQASVLPGRAAEPTKPTILDRDRNDGLEGEARSHSKRARDAARAADPAVTSTLRHAEWRAHHLINLAGLRAFPDLIRAAARAGWRTDDARNVAPPPASAEAQQKLKNAGIDRPVHDSGHANWNDAVIERLEDIRRQLRNGGPKRDSDAFARRAKEELEKLQDELRQKMLRLHRLTQADQVGTPVSA